jgi:hypothetical protein
MKKTIIFSILIIFVLQIKGQSLITERPGKAFSSSTLPHKSFQWEQGFSYESNAADYRGDITYYRNLGLSHTLLRYGLFEKIEIRAGTDLIRKTIKSGGVVDSAGNTLDIEPLSLGAKFQITAENRLIPELAILGHIILPSLSTLEGDRKAMPDIKLAGTFTPGRLVSIGFNLGLRWPDFTFAQTNLFYALMLGMSHSDNISSFLELYGYRDYYYAIDDLRMDAGIAYLVSQNFQLDISGGIGITDISPDFFLEIGFSWRLPQ